MDSCWFCMTPTLVNGVCSVCGRAPRMPAERDSGALPPGTMLDENSITVGETLGRGGFGITYVAYDHVGKRRIALKEFMPRRMINGRDGARVIVNEEFKEPYDHALRSFIREAKIINTLQSHPHIVRVFFRFEENNTCYYGMEYLEGESLSSWMKKQDRPLKAKEVCELLGPVMDALAFTHESKVLHRDISTDNIFLCRDPENPGKMYPKLIDFGAAFTAIAHFTQSYMNVRKGGFTPIEQQLWGIETQGTWTDEYALCATIYCLLTGRNPTPSLDRFLNKADLIPPSKLGIRISPEVEQVLLEGMALKREDRIPDVRTLQERLCKACGVKPFVLFREPRGTLTDVSDRLMGEADPGETRIGSMDVPLKELIGAAAEQILFFGGFVLAFGTPLAVLYAMVVKIAVDTICCFIPGRAGLLHMLLQGIMLNNEDRNTSPHLRRLCYCIIHSLPLLPLADVAMKLAGRSSLLESSLQLRAVSCAGQKSDEDEAVDDSGSQVYKVTDSFLIGRGEDAQLIVADPLISKHHCLIERSTFGSWNIRDLKSRNGTYLNKKQLTADQPYPLKSGDFIQLGEHSYVFH